MLPPSLNLAMQQKARSSLVPKGMRDRCARNPFLDLPGEIRNQIYDLVIPRSHVLVIGGHPQREFAQSQKHSFQPMSKPPRYRLSGHVLSINSHDADPLHVLRTCRQIYHDVIPIFYSKTTICFDNLKTIHKFLNVAPKRGLESICSLDLTISGYGEPYLVTDCQWKRKSDQKWASTCARLANELTGLQRLQLDLTVATWPLQLSTKAKWAQPLMTLKRDGLHSVRLKLRHHRVHENRLGIAARKFEDHMMTAEGRAARDLQEVLQAIRDMEAEQARKAAIPVRAKKVLVIKEQPKQADDEQTANTDSSPKAKKQKAKKAAPPPKPYYRTQGLTGFRRVDLSMVGVCVV